MKAEELIQALNDVDERYIKEAVSYKRTGGSVKLWRAIAIAACVCLAVSAALTITSMNHNGSLQTDSAKQAESDPGDYYAEEVEELPLYYAADEALSAPGSNAAVASEAAAPDYACEESTYDTYEEAVYDGEVYEDAAYEAKAATDSAEAGLARPALTGSGVSAEAMTEAQAQNAPKIIYNVYMEMQTREYDKAVSEIEQAVAACDGYSENQNMSNNSSAYRSASYTIRIPAGNLEDFLQQAGEIGTVTYINKSAEDVSEAYYDVQSRLDTARTKQERLQELLAQAEDMADIIEIESAISDTQWEIDNYSGTLRYYDSQVDYSTVNISLQEVYEVVTEEAPMNFGDKVAQAFTQGVKSVGEFFRDLVVWISSVWIWLLIIAAVAVAVILIIRKAVRTRKQKKDSE